MPTNIGQARSFDKKFSFRAEIDGFDDSAFQKCSELSAEIAKIEQWQGGALVPEKEPGRVTFTDVTLERGACDDENLWNWFQEVANVATNSGLITPKYKRNVDIVQLERDESEKYRWRLYEAWPTKFVAGDWDNGADENVITSVTLTYKRFERIKKAA